jgi:hypothetical protein
MRGNETSALNRSRGRIWRKGRFLESASGVTSRDYGERRTVGRKNYLFLGSDNGGTAAAVLYSILASAKANQVEPFA